MSDCSSYTSTAADATRALNALFIVAISASLLKATDARAVEMLTVHELSSHCAMIEMQPEGADAQYCIRYIQGFIDGAVATDVRVMLSAESGPEREETFSERAQRTRAPVDRADRFRAAQLAGFCLGDPLPLRDVVDKVAADLALMDAGEDADSLARDTVYDSLREHYPCDSE